VLAGVALAHVASITLSVIVGGLLGATLPEELIGVGGGVVHRVRALDGVVRAKSGAGQAVVTETAAESAGGEHPMTLGRLVILIATMMFVAELGDKTMLATATLAANGQALLVWVGATVGIIGAGFVGVVVGRMIGDRLPERALTIWSAILFALFDVVLISLNV